MDLFTLENIDEFIVGCEDNKGETCDRYGVGFYGGDVLCMSGAPTYPQGVSMWAQGGVDGEGEHGIDFEDLPEHIQAHTVARVNECYRDWAAGMRQHGHGNDALLDILRDEYGLG